MGLRGVLLESFGLVTFSAVTPGLPAGQGPESITTSRNYGFRARELRSHPGMTSSSFFPGPEVRPALPCEFFRLLPPPGCDLAVIAGQEHLRDRTPLPELRPGVL